jgi:glycosyltransferase involved in cell wall biosynthesis
MRQLIPFCTYRGTIVNRQINAAIVIFSFSPYHLARARALARLEGVRPHFIELAAELNSHPWQVEREKPPFDLRTLLRKPWESCSYLELCRSLLSSLKEIGPDIVVTTSFRPFIMLKAARWARSRGKPAVFFYETALWDRPRYRLAETVKRWVISRYYAGAFVGGKVHREYAIQLGVPEQRIWEPYDVVDNDHFASHADPVRTNSRVWRSRLQLPDHYFLYVGRFAPEKNLLRLLKAYLLYRTANPSGWSLVMVGDGPQRSQLEHFISVAGLDDRVVLRPFQQNELLPAYYALADCFVLPSTVDPWGLVVNEAMACGLPVLVSTLCGSGFDLVDEGRNGFRFDPRDLADLARLFATMASLSDVQCREMGEHSRRRIAPYSPNSWAEGLVNCLSVALEAR